MKKQMLLAIFLASLLIPAVNAWSELVPLPPNLTTTPLKEGDYITYKANVGFEGLNIAEIINQYAQDMFDPWEIQQIDEVINKTIEVIEKIEVKITVMAKTNASMQLNVYCFYNETINLDYNTQFRPLDSTNWDTTWFPFIRPPNQNHADIKQYTTPLVQNVTDTLKQQFPTLDPSTWFSVTTSEGSRYYAGQYRTINSLSIIVPRIKQHITQIIQVTNTTLTPEQQQLYDMLPDLDIDFYMNWDKETGVYLGSKFSAKFSSASWFSYRAVEIYAYKTNMWQHDTAQQIQSEVSNFFSGYGESIMTFAVEGLLFGDTESLLMLLIYIAVPSLLLLALIYVLIKMLKKRKT